MKFHEQQYLEFNNAVAKITKINGDSVKLRRMTAGETWDYQQKVSLQHLLKLHKTGHLFCIDYLTILRMLSKEKEIEGGIVS